MMIESKIKMYYMSTYSDPKGPYTLKVEPQNQYTATLPSFCAALWKAY